MGLSEYRRKRTFTKTPEPAPSAKRRTKKTGAADGKRPDTDLYVIQKHAARNTHYDLRLQVGDTLKSWAVPKGPSLDPREKRLAVEVEDHPVEYGSFEGNIPEGQYGAGSVMIWDRGRWSPEQPPATKALKDGELKFRLEGERLKGRWVLVRTNYAGKQPQWLLIKERDSEATPGVHAETFATSVATGRTMDEIAADAPARAPSTTAKPPLTAASLPGARPATMPPKLKPQLAVPSTVAPEGRDWLHEVKFDGYRLLLRRRGDSVKIHSRTGLDWTSKLPDLAASIQDRLRVDAILDGEAVVLDTKGISDFQALQNAIHSRRSKAIVFFAFDLPWCDGHDLTRVPLEERKKLLASLIGPRQEGRLRFSEHTEGNGPAFYASICDHGLEGIVSKRRSTLYAQARTPSWLKVKCFNQQEFVIGGFSAPEGSREELGALLLGYYEGPRALRFAGKVGTGFSTETLRKLSQQLRPRIQSKTPFINPPTGADARGVTWVRPELVAQVQFREWTGDDVIRHTSFRGLREDLDPTTVTRERPDPSTAPRPSELTDSTTPPVSKNEAMASKTSKSNAKAGTKPKSKRAAKSAKSSEAAPSTPGPSPLRLTNPDRIVFPDRGSGYALTKLQVFEYYEAVAPHMLPYVANRPLAILRCPDGEGGKSFFQKHPAKGMPAAVDSIEIKDDGTTGVAGFGRTRAKAKETSRTARTKETDSPDLSTRYLVIHDAAGLLGLVQMNVLEFHPWGSPASNPDEPDRIIFDLDPGPGISWRQISDAAAMLRQALTQIKLPAFARLSGGKGIHIVVPLRPGHTWDQVKTFTRAVAESMVRIAPRTFTATSIPAQREGRIYVDYLRNVRGATAISSYSTRAHPGGPVAVPVSWDELPGFTSAAALTIPAVLRRIATEPDPWHNFAKAAATLP